MLNRLILFFFVFKLIISIYILYIEGDDMKDLSELKINEIAIIKEVNTSDDVKKSLLNIGLSQGEFIECVLFNSTKEPVAYKVKQSLVVLRKEDIKKIMVEVVK